MAGAFDWRQLCTASQELANVERFTKRQQTVAAAEPHIERLLKEESYLQSRLAFVQQV